MISGWLISEVLILSFLKNVNCSLYHFKGQKSGIYFLGIISAILRIMEIIALFWETEWKSHNSTDCAFYVVFYIPDEYNKNAYLEFSIILSQEIHSKCLH